MKEIKRGELYRANLCPVTGSEQRGVRPVIILQNDVGNRHSPTTIVAALTSRIPKAHLPTHVAISSKKLRLNSTVLLEQIRTIDKSRLTEYIGKADAQTMKDIDRAMIISLGIEHQEVMHSGGR